MHENVFQMEINFLRQNLTQEKKCGENLDNGMLSGEIGRGENIIRRNLPKFAAAKLPTVKFPVAKFKTMKISPSQIFCVEI